MTDANTIQHTALIRIVRNVVEGQEPIGDLATKIGQLVGGEAKVVLVAEEQILAELLPAAAQLVIDGGLNTESFVAAAKDLGAKLLEKNITLAKTTIFTMLNTQVETQAVAAGVPLPTNAA